MTEASASDASLRRCSARARVSSRALSQMPTNGTATRLRLVRWPVGRRPCVDGIDDCAVSFSDCELRTLGYGRVHTLRHLGEYSSGPRRWSGDTPDGRLRISSLRITTAPGTAPTEGARPTARVDFPVPENPDRDKAWSREYWLDELTRTRVGELGGLIIYTLFGRGWKAFSRKNQLHTLIEGTSLVERKAIMVGRQPVLPRIRAVLWIVCR